MIEIKILCDYQVVFPKKFLLKKEYVPGGKDDEE
jgi:hypothetical protein